MAAARFPSKTQPQNVVMALDHAHRATQRRVIQRLADLKQERLVVIVRISQLLLEEPVLNGRERCIALDGPLFARHRIGAGHGNRRQLGDRRTGKQLFRR